MASLPPLMVLQVKGCGWVKHGNANAVVVENGVGVFDQLSKIEVEPSRTHYAEGYVHLRFCQTNQYWVRNDDGWIVAEAITPDEDTSKPSCTLFHYVAEGRLQHVYSNMLVNMNDSDNRLYVVADRNAGFAYLTILDWKTFIELPKHVAFRGVNGKYLQAYQMNHLQFSGDNAQALECGYQIYPQKNGCVSIKSDYYNKFWRLDSADKWICADSDDDGTDSVDTHFWPVSINGTTTNTIALRSESNYMFCERSESDCLKASHATIKNEAYLELEVVER